MKTALITGATDGIGRATAKVLLERGWQVVITGRNAAKCAATVSALKTEVPNAQVSALTADLSLMAEVRRLAHEFKAAHSTLDVLLLNANSITQEHTRTTEGFEANFAVGYLGRALLALLLADLLRSTKGSSVLTVVGLNLDRIDFGDPSPARGFSSMNALGRWQWAMQVFTREWNVREPQIAMNVFMPGLVKTKILADEPMPARLIIPIAKALVGVTVEKSGLEVATVIDRISNEALRDGYFSRTKLAPRRALKDQPGDQTRLWDSTQAWLAKWLT